MTKLIGLVGAGQIGGTLAHLISLKQLGDIVMFDVNEDLAKAKALDIQQANAIAGSSVRIKGTKRYEDLAGCDVAIITAGFPRKPGMSRDDLVKDNCNVMISIAKGLRQYAPEAFVICVTNPLDAMVWVLRMVSELHKSKIVGMAGALDCARFRFFLGQELGASTADIQTILLGGHGDDMVPLPRYTSIAGVPLAGLIREQRISEERVAAIVERTRKGGGEIVSLLKTGSAYYAPAASAILIAESYLYDQKKTISCSAYLEGEYQVDGLFIGVPVVIGSQGVEKIVQLELNDEERAMFDLSVKSVKELVSLCQTIV